MTPRAEKFTRSIVWLRRDLRLSDNVALYEAARHSESLCIAFVLNPLLLREGRFGAPLVQAFFGALAALRADLRVRGSDLAILEGDFSEELLRLARRIDAQAIFYNEDYEPEAVQRDATVEKHLSADLVIHRFLDHVYFGASEILQSAGAAYKVFTSYKRRWLDQRALANRPPLQSQSALEGKLLESVVIGSTSDVPEPEAWGYVASAHYPGVAEAYAHSLLDHFTHSDGGIFHYRERRDFPAIAATSQLSPQLRAGTIGIRTCVERAFSLLEKSDPVARENIETWISELIWRDFYQMVLKQWPHVATQPFHEAGRRIVWRDSESDFSAWCAGLTGYPIVDAAMRQLNTYGWMHNRLRMITASFLTKDLLLDWRRGERYFEDHLADADLAQNNGGWQWSSSTGNDAVPYFRIFNPVLQSKKFDPEGTFIRTMLPELARVPIDYIHEPWRMPPLLAAENKCTIGTDYPMPIVDHTYARAQALCAYAVLGKGVV